MFVPNRGEPNYEHEVSGLEKSLPRIRRGSTPYDWATEESSLWKFTLICHLRNAGARQYINLRVFEDFQAAYLQQRRSVWPRISAGGDHFNNIAT